MPSRRQAAALFRRSRRGIADRAALDFGEHLRERAAGGSERAARAHRLERHSGVRPQRRSPRTAAERRQSGRPSAPGRRSSASPARARCAARGRCPASACAASSAERVGRQASRARGSLRRAMSLGERVDERREVVEPLAQRRQAHRQTRSAGSRGPRGTRPPRPSRARSRLVAAMTRTSMRCDLRWLPSGSTSLLLEHAQQLGLQRSGMSPISSRNSVPPSAASNAPVAPLRSAPVNAPARGRTARSRAASRGSPRS